MWILPPPVALLFCAATGGFDANATVIAETRVGEAPLVAGGGTQAGVVGIVTPLVDGQYLDHAFDLRLQYAARIFWRHPNEENNLRPLILHTANFATVLRPAHRLRLASSVNLTAGAADYTSLSQPTNPAGGVMGGTGGATGAGQSTVPNIRDFLSVSADVNGEVLASRTWTAGLDARVTHRRSFGVPASLGSDPNSLGLRPQTTTAITPFVRDHVTRLTEASLSAPVSYTTYDDGTAVYTGSSLLGLSSSLDRQWGLRVSAGLGVTHVSPGSSLTAATPGNTNTIGPSTQWGPIGGVESTLALLSKHEAALRLSFGLVVEEYVDPILQIAGPRGTAVARVTAFLSPQWTAGVEGSFSTSLARHPAVVILNGVPQLPPDETAASAALPIRYRASDEMLVEFGGRWSDRGPHLAAPGGFHQRQLWFYVMLQASTRRLPRWTP